MNRSLIALCLGLVSATGFARSISDVQQDGAWYRIYDENGKQVQSVSAATYGELKGFSSTILVFENGGFFYVYDINLKKQFSGAVATYGEVKSVAGDTFTTHYGNWVYTYNKAGKKINSRAK